MIWTVMLKYGRKHLGIVNEPGFDRAMLEANRLYGLEWSAEADRFIPIAVAVEPGETQR